MKNNNNIKKVVIKKSDHQRKFDRARKMEMLARRAAQKSAAKLVDTAGIIDWPKSAA